MSDQEPTRYVQSGTGKLKPVGRDMAVYVKEEKAIHVLNPTAFLVYQALEDPTPLEHLVIPLQELTGVEEVELRRDLEEAIEQLLKAGLVKEAGDAEEAG